MTRSSIPDRVVNAPQPRKYRGFRSLVGKFNAKRNLTASTAEPPDYSYRSRFCSACRNIDWDSILDYKSSLSARHVLQTNLIGTSDCRFCNFLVRSLSNFPRLARHDLFIFRVNPTFTPLLGATEALVLGLVPEWNFQFRSYDEFTSDLIFEVSESTAQILCPIQPFIDLASVKGWLELCLDWHTNRCGPSGFETPDLCVIDCKTRDIVAHPKDAPYVTLSYVWGQKNENHTSSDRSLPGTLHLSSDVPQTIEDAIKVTLELGYQYIWVDKYCMDQSATDFHTMLKQMNLVYQNSVLTIIAAAGSGSSHGLPGISSGRIGSPHIKLGQKDLSSVPISVREELDNSVWNSRGWTYQEGLFSTRRLLFTERQVYFECQGYYCFEGIRSSMHTLTQLHLFNRQGFVTSLHSKEPRGPWPIGRSDKLGVFPANRTGSSDIEIKYRIEEYSRRTLSYQGDILNAMLGLFELYDLQFRVRHIWGIPYVSNHRDQARNSSLRAESISFLHSLRWMHKTPSKRRVPFPSWSWAGWFDAIYMVNELSRIDNRTEIWMPVDIRFVDTGFSMYLERVDGTLIDWTPTAAQSNVVHDTTQLDLGRFLHIVTAVGRVLPAMSDECNVYSLEPECPGGDTFKVMIDMDSEGCSPNKHELYAISWPWEGWNWTLVIQHVGECWERVGLANVLLPNDSRTPSWKRTRTTIRLG